jgi:ParB family chromosome partitioning protein
MPDVRKKLFSKSVDLTKKKIREGEEHPVTGILGYPDGAYMTVGVREVLPNEDQPRKHFDKQALTELTRSIKEKGVLQPILIRVDRENEKVFLVAGERRLRAAKDAGLEKIPAIVTTGEPAEIALIENLQREDLNPIEEAEALSRLMDKHNYTQEKLSSVIGKDRTSVTSTLTLNRLPQEIKSQCLGPNTYPKRLLIEVARQKTPEAMHSLFNQIKQLGLKSDQVKAMVRKKIKKTKGRASLTILNGALNYIEKLDLDSFEAEEKVKVLTLLEKITRAINRVAK